MPKKPAAKRTTNRKPVSAQVKTRAESPPNKKSTFEPSKGNTETMISTGSTLLDLAVSGSRIRGGGLPGGILVEIFGPSGSGKTVLLCEIAGGIQRAGGDIMFHDPEARLNKTFSQLFDLDTENMEYTTPDTIPQVFGGVRAWKPEGTGINGVLADSLAALSTDMEMENEEGDKMGGRRGKEFSEQLRRTCRTLTKENILMVCSNQIRDNMNARPGQEKTIAPGGKSFGFYSSLRLRATSVFKITQTEKIKGKEIKRPIGITTIFDVYKSSVDKPHRSAPISILYDYGIDDIRENLKFVKQFTGAGTYCIGETTLNNGIEKAIAMVEEQGLEKELKEATIDLWESIEARFSSDRKKKQR